MGTGFSDRDDLVEEVPSVEKQIDLAEVMDRYKDILAMGLQIPSRIFDINVNPTDSSGSNPKQRLAKARASYNNWLVRIEPILNFEQGKQRSDYKYLRDIIIALGILVEQGSVDEIVLKMALGITGSTMQERLDPEGDCVPFYQAMDSLADYAGTRGRSKTDTTQAEVEILSLDKAPVQTVEEALQRLAENPKDSFYTVSLSVAKQLVIEIQSRLDSKIAAGELVPTANGDISEEELALRIVKSRLECKIMISTIEAIDSPGELRAIHAQLDDQFKTNYSERPEPLYPSDQGNNIKLDAEIGTAIYLERDIAAAKLEEEQKPGRRIQRRIQSSFGAAAKRTSRKVK